MREVGGWCGSTIWYGGGGSLLVAVSARRVGRRGSLRRQGVEWGFGRGAACEFGREGWEVGGLWWLSTVYAGGNAILIAGYS
jgi:hypothetical protein